MRRITDAELVREYCEKHKGDIFDINYLSEHTFKDIPHTNLRKIVSRLIESGLLRTISKGVYMIGESSLSDEEVVINHYLTSDLGSRTGSPVGKYLLYTEGFISREPVIKTIKTNRTKGNKKIGNVQIIESHSLFIHFSTNSTLAVGMELLEAGGPDRTELLNKYGDFVHHCFNRYTDSKFIDEVKDIYPPRVYYELEQILDSMRISHNIRETYAVQVRLHSKK